MDLSRLIQMILRRFLMRFVSRGIAASFDKFAPPPTKTGPTKLAQKDMTPAEREQAKAAREQAKAAREVQRRARQATKLTRRF